MRILLVSQMYPGPTAPDLGVFVQTMERELGARGHELELAVLDQRAGGKLRYLRLARRSVAAARRSRPDVVYAHFLVPTGVVARLSTRAPLVVTAHGQDVANAREHRLVRAATRFVVRRASAVVAVSDYLRRELEAIVSDSSDKVEVIDMGVDLERFHPLDRAPGPGPAFLCVGSLIPRKNVVRLARAFGRLGEGTLTFAGDGPLRSQLEGMPGVTVLGAVAQERVPELLAAADVLCQPSLVEPFGLATLEALAAARTVVATRVGGPPEFVTAGAGILVDPLDEDALVEALRSAAGRPTPNPQARAAAEPHDVRLQAARVEAILERAAVSR